MGQVAEISKTDRVTLWLFENVLIKEKTARLRFLGSRLASNMWTLLLNIA
jgi:hypothetical protein